MSQQNNSFSPPPHGGSYQPGGSRATAEQEQYYAQSNSPQRHGGNYQPGQHGQNVPQEKEKAPGSTQGQMTAAPRGAYPEQTGWQQQQQPQQPNFIPGPAQPHIGYNPANQVRVPYLCMTFAETI
jgi:hypothetical protein